VEEAVDLSSDRLLMNECLLWRFPAARYAAGKRQFTFTQILDIFKFKYLTIHILYMHRRVQEIKIFV
jgi:hypothetical protein